MSTQRPQQFTKNSRMLPFLIGGGILLVIVIILASSTFRTVESGQAAVIFRPFSGGLAVEQVYGQGLHIIAPWNTMYVYSVRLQETSETMDVLASNGLSILMDVSFRFRPNKTKLGFLHDELGPQYKEKLIQPEMRSAARKVIGKYKPEQLYSTKRQVIQKEIEKELKSTLEKRFVNVDAVLIRSIQLPKKITEAIELKLKQEQEFLQYEFRIQKASKEAERKRIEAKGIRDRQRIINEGLTDRYLKYKGIEATERLADSKNSKVVVIGGGDEGLPLILGDN
ncbi:MAG: prohibitin family protein [Bacteroidota bacterium]